MKTVLCDDAHGRLPWLGHVTCVDCERWHKHQPARCICGSTTFQAACAKCFVSAHRSEAQAAYTMMGEMPVPGRGAAIE